MNAVLAGTAIATVVAGWPLYELVTSGDLDATTAMVRGAVVAAGCAVGVTLVVRLALGYEAQHETQRRRKLDHLFSEMEDAVAEGSLTDEHGAPAHPDGHGPDGRPRPGKPGGTTSAH